MLVAPEAEKYPPTLVEVAPVAVFVAYKAYLVIEAEALAPDTERLTRASPVKAAVELEEISKALPEVKELATIVKASVVVPVKVWE